MSIDEIVHTCSNEHVARAAVASIGVSFASRVRFVADLLGVSVGVFTAQTVRTFGEEASAGARREVVRAMVRSDQPILRGLEAILERELEDSSLLDRGEWQSIRPSLTSRPDLARDCCCP
ncbi:MAG: hypothetical protein P4L68_07555 [Methylovirgula sp.]|nr:hypothetical protein [Methylovirgula sp.]